MLSIKKSASVCPSGQAKVGENCSSPSLLPPSIRRDIAIAKIEAMIPRVHFQAREEKDNCPVADSKFVAPLEETKKTLTAECLVRPLDLRIFKTEFKKSTSNISFRETFPLDLSCRKRPAPSWPEVDEIERVEKETPTVEAATESTNSADLAEIDGADGASKMSEESSCKISSKRTMMKGTLPVARGYKKSIVSCRYEEATDKVPSLDEIIDHPIVPAVKASSDGVCTRGKTKLDEREEIKAPLEPSVARYLLAEVGGYFCEIVQLHKDLDTLNKSLHKDSGDKSDVPCMKLQHNSSDCDLCKKTIFNFLCWACEKCPFVICLPCYKGPNFPQKHWPSPKLEPLLCKKKHQPSDLVLTQSMAVEVLTTLSQKLHKICSEKGVKLKCTCLSLEKRAKMMREKQSEILKLKCEDASFSEWDSSDSDAEEDVSAARWTPLRNWIRRPSEGSIPPPPPKKQIVRDVVPADTTNVTKVLFGTKPITLETVMTLSVSRQIYPNVPHVWHCDGRLLVLTDPVHPDNLEIFQDQWKVGKPVVVKNSASKLQQSTWHPLELARILSTYRVILVDCLDGLKCWDSIGLFLKKFDVMEGGRMWKLENWPTKTALNQMLPEHTKDLMKALPLEEYTSPSGKFNLASRLPDRLVKTDHLGPRLLISNGSPSLTTGTVDLCSETSDFVNILMHASSPRAIGNVESEKALRRAVDSAGCDVLTRRMVRGEGVVPGALWHIYNPSDTSKINNFLEKVVEANPEQKLYLDETLRSVLLNNHNIVGYSVIQCIGDAVFVPAGALFQVKHLQNCISVKQNFVSPENGRYGLVHIRKGKEAHCVGKLFLQQSAYHTVKDSVNILSTQQQST